MKIDRHRIDDEYVKDMAARKTRSFKDIAEYTWARTNPKNLDLLISAARDAIAYGCLLDPESPKLPEAVKLGAQASAALFAAASASTSHPVTVQLGEENVTYTSPPDESTVESGKWIRGFYLCQLCRDLPSYQILCGTPIELIAKSSTKGGAYHRLYVEALQLFATSKPDVTAKIAAAIHATDPERSDVYDPDWTLYLHVPQLTVLYLATTDDPKFEESLANAVESHKKFWSKSKMRRRDSSGYVSIELTALAALGRERGLPFDVESPYLPMHLAKQ